MATIIIDEFRRSGNQGAVSEVKYIKGAWQSVNSLEDLNSIDVSRIENDQIVLVSALNSLYKATVVEPDYVTTFTPTVTWTGYNLPNSNVEVGDAVGEAAVVTVSNGVFAIDGTERQALSLSKSFIYTFDVSDPSNANNTLRFSTTANGTIAGGTEYVEGVGRVGVPGQPGAQVAIAVKQSTPEVLYYYSDTSVDMGSSVQIGNILTQEPVSFANLTISNNLTVQNNTTLEGNQFMNNLVVPESGTFTYKGVSLDTLLANGIDTDTFAQYKQVLTNVNQQVIVDAVSTPKAFVELQDTASVYTLTINNVGTKTRGSLLVFVKGNGATLNHDGNLLGNWEVNSSGGSITKIDYFMVDGDVYAQTSSILDPAAFTKPASITDLTLMHVDASQAIVRFTSPTGINASTPASYYRVKYSQEPIKKEEPDFINAQGVLNVPAPQAPGRFESVVIPGLKQDTFYYVQVQAVISSQGTEYTSELFTEDGVAISELEINTAADEDENTSSIIFTRTEQYLDHMTVRKHSSYLSSMNSTPQFNEWDELWRNGWALSITNEDEEGIPVSEIGKYDLEEGMNFDKGGAYYFSGWSEAVKGRSAPYVTELNLFGTYSVDYILVQPRKNGDYKGFDLYYQPYKGYKNPDPDALYPEWDLWSTVAPNGTSNPIKVYHKSQLPQNAVRFKVVHNGNYTDRTYKMDPITLVLDREGNYGAQNFSLFLPIGRFLSPYKTDLGTYSNTALSPRRQDYEPYTMDEVINQGHILVTPPDLMKRVSANHSRLFIAGGHMHDISYRSIGRTEDDPATVVVSSRLDPETSQTVIDGPFVISGDKRDDKVVLSRTLTEYSFDVSDASNLNKVMRFSETRDGSNAGGVEYTEGITRTGTPGQAGALVTLAITENTPPILHYYRDSEAGKGGTINIGGYENGFYSSTYEEYSPNYNPKHGGSGRIADVKWMLGNSRMGSRILDWGMNFPEVLSRYEADPIGYRNSFRDTDMDSALAYMSKYGYKPIYVINPPQFLTENALRDDKQTGNKASVPFDWYITNPEIQVPDNVNDINQERWNKKTADPFLFKAYAGLVYELADRWGSNTSNPPSRRQTGPHFSGTDYVEASGLDYISGIELLNEPDLYKSDSIHWRVRPEVIAAMYSACYDGHMNQLEDEDGNRDFGIKNADPNLKLYLPGFSQADVAAYMDAMHVWWETHRANDEGYPIYPYDVMNVHHYSSTASGQSYAPERVGLPPEQDRTLFDPIVDPNTDNTFYHAFDRTMEWKRRNVPNKPIILTEWGIGEHGNRNELGGSFFGAPNVGNLHKTYVSAAWVVRGFLQWNAKGMDLISYYWLFDENENQGQGHTVEPGYWLWDENGPMDGYREIDEAGGKRKFFTTGMSYTYKSGYYPLKPKYFYTMQTKSILNNKYFVRHKMYDDNGTYCLSYVDKDDDNSTVYAIYHDIDYPREPIVGVSVSDAGRHRTNVVVEVPEGVTSVDVVELQYPRHLFPAPHGVTQEMIDEGDYGLLVTPYVGQPRVNGQIHLDSGTGTPANPRSMAQQLEAYENFLADPANSQYVDGLVTQTLTVADGRVVVPRVDLTPKFLVMSGGRDYPKPNRPLNFGVYSEDSTSLTLTWENQQPTDKTYQVFIAEAGQTPVLEGTYDSLDNKIKVTGLTEGTTYSVYMTCVSRNNLGEVIESSEATRTKQGSVLSYEAPVTNLTISNIKGLSASISWDHVVTDNTQAYYVEYSIDPVENFQRLATVEPGELGARSYQITSRVFEYSTEYYVRIIVRGSLGNSQAAVSTPFTTLSAEVSPPVLVGAISTNADGTGIYANFSLPMNETTTGAGLVVAQFASGANGAATYHNITSAQRISDTRYQFLFAGNLDSLAGEIRLSYQPSIGQELLGGNGVAVEPFSEQVVSKAFNTTADVVDTYQINFTKQDLSAVDPVIAPSPKTIGNYWNDIVGEELAPGGSALLASINSTGEVSPTSPQVYQPIKTGLFDRTEEGAVVDDPINVHPHIGRNRGWTTSTSNIENVYDQTASVVYPDSVTRTYWKGGSYQSPDTDFTYRSQYGTLVFRGLNTENRIYDIEIFAGGRYTASTEVFFEIYGNELRETPKFVPDNTSNLFRISGVVPNESGEIWLAAINWESYTTGVPLGFVRIIERDTTI